ncbi:MAG: PSD1 and planctomycete cytochrome C domain-containing protein [Verrucomicrobiota bacterium]
MEFPRFFIAAAIAGLCSAPPSAWSLDFTRDVLPIFETHCFECHGMEKQRGGVGLATFHHAQQPTDSGEPLLIAGDPVESVLVHMIEEDAEKRMPLNGPPLSSAEIETIRNWIASGAQRPDDGWRPPKHWAYEKPVRPSVPKHERDQWDRNEIDAFVLARQQELGFAPNPEAEPAQLLRRLYLDLIGLPPTVEEVDAFLADYSDAAYERVVDSLLARPQFGERWAQHWLDLARFADSEGYQRDEYRWVWPYRDWVITALNDDMPFDQFTIEQIAGDLLPKPKESQLIATGFHRNTPLNLEAGTDPESDRYLQIVERVNTTGTVWLGTTISCAQCHNHKYDPFSTNEYYELYAFYNGTANESRQTGEAMGMSGMVYIGTDYDMPSAKAIRPMRNERQRRLDAAKLELSSMVDPEIGKLRDDEEEWKKLAGNVRKSMAKDPMERKASDLKLIVTKVFKGNKEANALLRTVTDIEEEIVPYANPSARIMKDTEMRETFVAKRGDFLSKGTKVDAATPDILHEFPVDASRNRLGLANWLVSPENPLTARVTANRLWSQVFGTGIVTTLDDFGTMGEAPTHPNLLDWLAIAFIEDDAWSMKRFIRRMVLSSTYRQSNEVKPGELAQDPSNQFYWRHPGHRLPAETIRDNTLAISGRLSPRMGGPSVKPMQPDGVWRNSAGAGPNYYVPSVGQDLYRRGIYTLIKRQAPFPAFLNFDAPDRGACVVQRTRSNTPLQALTLMNDPSFVSMTNAFAKRIAAHEAETDRQRIHWAFRTTLARYPTLEELDILQDVFEQGNAAKKNNDHAGWFDVASTLFNLHETISRP